MGREAPHNGVLVVWRSGPPLGQDVGVFPNSLTPNTPLWSGGGVPSLACLLVHEHVETYKCF